MSREKGKRGEREVAALIHDLLGVKAARRVRQHEGDSDIVGVDGWAVEVKRYGVFQPALVTAWWAQAVAQADETNAPVLFFRFNRHPWRARWPLAVTMDPRGGGPATAWPDLWVEGSPEAWAAVARERMG